ncbi:MAG: adenylate/guanylate cyclase domain-containing protein [Acidimicrobiia bacterium]
MRQRWTVGSAVRGTGTAHGSVAAAARRWPDVAPPVAPRYGETLTLRVGINTGEVVIGAGDADLIGDALNVAARLEKACRPSGASRSWSSFAGWSRWLHDGHDRSDRGPR